MLLVPISALAFALSCEIFGKEKKEKRKKRETGKRERVEKKLRKVDILEVVKKKNIKK